VALGTLGTIGTIGTIGSIGSGDISELWELAWPWVWPTLALVVGVALATWGVRRWRGWIGERFRSVTLKVSDRFVVNLSRVLVLGIWIGGLFLWLLAVPLGPGARSWVRDSAEPWVLATMLVAAFLAFGFYMVRKGMLWLESRAALTDTSLDDALIEALNRPLYVALVLLALNIWASIAPIPPVFQTYVAKASQTIVVVLIILFADGLVQGWMIARAEKSKVLKTSGVVLRTTARVLFYIIGVLMALSAIGLDVTPVLATLGIGSAAAGFALKGTLEDFLAGLLIAADQPLSVGDFIIVDEEHQGWVLTIGWRATRILTRFDMHVIVPNSKLSAAMFVNTSRPREDCRFHAIAMVGYAKDLDLAVRIASEVGEIIQKEDPRAVPTFRAVGFIEAFRPGYAELRTWLCAKSWDAHFGLRDAYLRRLHRRLREVGIEIPNPIRTLEVADSLSALNVSGPASGAGVAPRHHQMQAPTMPSVASGLAAISAMAAKASSERTATVVFAAAPSAPQTTPTDDSGHAQRAATVLMPTHPPAEKSDG